jgi:hypothetical protein
VAGRRAAGAGIDLGEALDRLRAATAGGAWRGAASREPSYDAVRALCVAWADETLGLVQRVSCEDVLTGLATPAHLQARLGEAYRAGEQDRLAVVVVEWSDGRGGDGSGSSVDAMSGAYCDVQAAERVRWALPGAAVVCRGCAGRLLVLTRRTPALGAEVGDLVALMEGVTGPARTRAWIEGLPQTWEAAGQLVGELARR